MNESILSKLLMTARVPYTREVVRQASRRRCGQILDELSPTLRSQPPFVVAQVVGTNGKGSTAAMVAHGLGRVGARRSVGMYTSPHLEQLAERIRVDGRPISDAVLEPLLREILAAEQQLDVQLSGFGRLTVAALLHFVDAGCKTVILEAGLGARYDATTAMPAELVLFSRFGLDHAHELGDSVAAVAADKAEALRPTVRAFSVTQEPVAEQILRTRAQEGGLQLEFVTPAERAPEGLPGPHQRDNAALALAGLRVLEADAQPSWLDGVRWAGRLERIVRGRGVAWLDVAHNVDGAHALTQSMVNLGVVPHVVVFGVTVDKRPEQMLEILRRQWPTSRFWLVPPLKRKAMVPRELALAGERVFSSPTSTLMLSGLDNVLDSGGVVLICGAHTVVGPARIRLRDPRPLHAPR